jgi:hypothetical protein
MAPAAVLLERPRRAGDASGVLQFIRDADALPRHDTARYARAAAVQGLHAAICHGSPCNHCRDQPQKPRIGAGFVAGC